MSTTAYEDMALEELDALSASLEQERMDINARLGGAGNFAPIQSIRAERAALNESIAIGEDALLNGSSVSNDEVAEVLAQNRSELEATNAAMEKAMEAFSALPPLPDNPHARLGEIAGILAQINPLRTQKGLMEEAARRSNDPSLRQVVNGK